MNLEQIIEIAVDRGLEAVDAKEHRESNGSEAWQAVVIETKGNIKLQNQLKKLGYEKDAYWGYTISSPFANFYKNETFIDVVAKQMTEMGIKSRPVERLL